MFSWLWVAQELAPRGHVHFILDFFFSLDQVNCYLLNTMAFSGKSKRPNPEMGTVELCSSIQGLKLLMLLIWVRTGIATLTPVRSWLGKRAWKRALTWPWMSSGLFFVSLSFCSSTCLLALYRELVMAEGECQEGVSERWVQVLRLRAASRLLQLVSGTEWTSPRARKK